MADALSLSHTSPRVKDVAAARAAIESIVKAWDWHNQYEARHQGLIDGNPPYNATKLRERGELWRSNIPTLEGKSILSTALVPYYDLFTSSPTFFSTTFRDGNEDQKEQWKRAAETAFQEMLEDWNYPLRMWPLLRDFLGFGRGYAFWRDLTDWQFRYVHRARVLFPDDTPTDPDAWECFVILQRLRVHQLQHYLDLGASAEQTGWNLKALQEAIREATSDEPEPDAIDYQRQTRDHETLAPSKSATVKLGILYSREPGGKWSRHIVDRATADKDKGASDFLYKRVGYIDDVRQVLAAFHLEVLEDSVKGMSGLAKDIYGLCAVMDRLTNKRVDNGFIRSNIILKCLNQSTRHKVGLTEIGGVMVIPPGYEAQNATIIADMEGSLALDRDLRLQLSRNTGVYRPTLDQPTGNPRTLGEIQMQYGQASMLSNSAVMRFYLQLDSVGQEMWRRATGDVPDDDLPGHRAARKLQAALKRAGVPASAIAHARVIATRMMGNGSMFAKQQSFGALLNVAPEFPQEGRRNLIEDIVAFYGTQAQVPRYMPEPTRSSTQDDWEAMQENAAIVVGVGAVRTDRQSDTVHAVRHLEFGQQAPSRMLVEHILQHLQAMPEKQAKAFESAFNDLVSVVQQQEQEAAEAEEAQQQAAAVESGQDPETRLKAAELERKLGMQEAKTQHQMTLRQQKHELDQAIAVEKAAVDRAIKGAAAAASQSRPGARGS